MLRPGSPDGDRVTPSSRDQSGRGPCDGAPDFGETQEVLLLRPSVQSATTRRVDGRELVVVTARAPGRRVRRCWLLATAPRAGGRLIAGGMLKRVSDPLPAGGRAAGTPLSGDAFCAWLSATLQRTRAAGMQVEPEISRAVGWLLGESSTELGLAPLPEGGDPALRIDPLSDRARLFDLMDVLLDEFERRGPRGEQRAGALWRAGDLVCGAMIEFKGLHADGRVGRWTRADVREFMLTWLPQAVVIDDETLIEDIPHCACAFLRFLVARGSLDGDAPAVLESAVRATAPAMAERMRCVARTGMAGRVLSELHSRRTDDAM